MKGMTHFISGVAAATFVEAAVTGAAAEGSLALVLAGAGGILPDTLDFKFAQFLEFKDVDVEPDPRDPDPQAIADAAARAMTMALEEDREVRVHFHTAQLTGDLSRQYFLRFDPAGQALHVRIGPAVTMSQVPVDIGDGVAGRTASAALPRPIHYDYEEESAVDIFHGPVLGFRPSRKGDGAVDVLFIPWHRRWTHSLTVGTVLAAAVALAFGPLYGLCMGIGWFTHVLEDQLGHMGSNLFYPFTRDRFRGMKLMRSGDALPNFFFVWLAVALIFFNLNRFHPDPVISPDFFTGFLPYIALAFVAPFTLLWLAGKLFAGVERRRAGRLAPLLAETEAKMEMDENFSG